MLRTFQPEIGFTDLSDWHFADMAAPLGGAGLRGSRRAQRAASWRCSRRWPRAASFQLIEAMIPRGVLSDTLVRFVKGVRRLQQPAAEVPQVA